MTQRGNEKTRWKLKNKEFRKLDEGKGIDFEKIKCRQKENAPKVKKSKKMRQNEETND